MNKNVRCAVSGFFAGILNGLFGGGGGLVLVPLLSRFAGMETKKAHATSVAVMGALCLVSAVLYLAAGRVRLSDAGWYMAGGAAGGFAGAVLMKKVPDRWLRRGLGLFLLYAGGRLLLGG